MPESYAPAGDEMDSAYSGEAPVNSPAEKSSVDEQNATSETALVPNKILCPGGEPLKDGEEILVRVVKNHGEESEIECVSQKESTEESSMEGETPGNEEAELAALDEKG